MSRWPCVPKPLPGCDAVLVDHAQRPEAHVPRIVIVAERERVPAGEPAELGDSALGRFADLQHGVMR